LRLHFDGEGDGPLVVLLHGFPESRLTWKRQLPALAAAGFRAVAPDLRGYGDSPRPKGVERYRVPVLVEDVVELIEAEGRGEPCVLVGHDWGAVVAWSLSMMRPDLVRRLVILNVPHPAAIAREVKRSGRQKLKLLYQLFFQMPLLPELFMRLFGKSLMRRAGRFTEDEIDAYARQWHLTPMLSYYRALRHSRGEMRRLVRRIEMPVLILWGEREPVFLASAIEDLDAWVTDVRIERIPRAGHFVQRDAPERVSELIIGFIEKPA
jgi:pimeloyl-ACP methyl ester carboxylesterase